MLHGLEGSDSECLVQNCEGVEAVLRCRRRELVDRGVVRVRCEVRYDLRCGSVGIHTETIDPERYPRKYLRIRSESFSPARGRHEPARPASLGV